MITELIPVVVECHSGYKADEYPTCIINGGKRIDISQVIDRWYQIENTSDFPASDYFKVQMPDGNVCLLKHELDADKWYLVTSF